MTARGAPATSVEMSTNAFFWTRFRARVTLLWERGYALAPPILGGFCLWAAAAWLGIWQSLPPLWHLAGLLGLLAGTGVLLVLAWRRLGPERAIHIDRRIETDSGIPRGLLAALRDTPANGTADSVLWQRHQQQLRVTAARLTVGRPHALVDRVDPFALRYAALILAGVGFVVAGADRLPRLAAGLAPDLYGHDALRVEVWIDPPAYTALPPTFLVRSAAMPRGTLPIVTVPEGATLRAQLSRSDGRHVGASGRLADSNGTRRLAPETPAGQARFAEVITADAALEIGVGGRRAIWPIRVTPDLAPEIEWTDTTATEGGTRLRVGVLTRDDYGVASAQLAMRLSTPVVRPPDAPPADPAIAEAWDRVALPALHGAAGARTIEVDLTTHPFAGLAVDIVIEVTDGAGQMAATPIQQTTIPTRTFYNPLARAVVEQRQQLALSPQAWKRTARTFDALTFAPDRFARTSREYLLLRTAYHDVFTGKGQNTDELVESLWPLAVSLEDESLTSARERLEAAQAALRDALARGAPQSEIDQLIEDLRDAMRDYLAALAQSADAQSTAEADDDTLEGRDLEDILNEIAELRRQGDTEEARARLAELEELLQNLQIVQGGQGSGSGQAGSGGQGGGSGSPSGQGEGDDGEGQGLSATGNLIQQQRELSDETFSARRGDRDGGGLAEGQAALADAARALSDQAGSADSDLSAPAPGSEDANARAQNAFRAAEDAMRAAADALARGNLGAAQRLQETAIDELRSGGRALAEAQAGDGDDPPDDGQNAGGQNARAGQMQGRGDDRDPLGRPYGRQGETGINIPDYSDPERVRQLTEKLREQLSDPGISDTQRRYLEELLRRF